MYSAYKLNKQGDNIQPWSTPFLILNQSVAPCPILTFASWPTCRFLRRQVRWCRKVWQPVLAHKLRYSCLENPRPEQRSLASHSLQGRKELDTAETTPRAWPQDFLCLWQYFFAPVRVNSEGDAAAWLAGMLLAPSVSLYHRSYGPMRVFSWAFCSWGSEGLFGLSFSIALPVQALKGLPCLEPFSVVRCIRHIEGPPWPGSYSVVQCFRCLGPLSSLLLRGWCRHVGKERLWWWLHPLGVTQQYHLASMAAWLLSTGIYHHKLLLNIPSTHLSAVNNSHCPGIAPQSLNSSSQLLHLAGDLHPCPGYVWLQQGLSDSLCI